MNVLVLDCGSSSLKATVFGHSGRIIAESEASYPAVANPNRRAPAVWWDATVSAVDALARRDVGAVALTGTMENLIPLGPSGEPVLDAVMYSDPCGTSSLEGLAAGLASAGAKALIGNTPEPLMTAFKLGWFRQAQPEAYAATRMILPGSKDYLAFRLTGQFTTDAATATTTGLMDIVSRQWVPELLELLGINADLLPPILPADAVVGQLSVDAAGALGLPPGLPVINGCGDGAATTIGSGAERDEEISVYLGTSGWVAQVAEKTDRNPRPCYRLAHPLHGGLIEIAPILSAGAATNWARETLGLSLPEAEAAAIEADRKPGGVLFLPYLNGERSPFVDLALRAGFAGVSGSDGTGALYYAVLEGVALALAANVSAMGARGRVFLVGGGATSAVWPQVVADVLDREVVVPPHPVASSSFGAFRVAAKALGLVVDLAEGGRTFRPRPERRDRIARQIKAFEAATGMLRQLAALG